MVFNTPILFLVFNRPDHTRQVFERIRDVKPRYLFVAADGPREFRIDDEKKCSEVREIISSGIDWNCDVKTLYRSENLGCGKGVSASITWFFENVDHGIILEDDCLPEFSFFQFCSHLLEYYKNDKEIMHIGGSNFQSGKNMQDYSYYFSAYSHNWGWATWKRSWAKFNFLVRHDEVSNVAVSLRKYGFDRREINYWIKIFEIQSQTKQSDIWDYQWLSTIWLNHGLCIVPHVNLVRNIGFDSTGTHTKETHNFLSISSRSLDNFRHPVKRKINILADHYTFKNFYLVRPSLLTRVLFNLRSLLKSCLKVKY